ncbi:MAG: hypothetical protein QF922_06010 [SAR324 cluster bacterium]|nr:hypothetical protein [SAR324 cluster bacterium]
MSRALVKELDGNEHPETRPPRLVGARVGDLRIWQRSKGNLELEILEIAEITCP